MKHTFEQAVSIYMRAIEAGTSGGSPLQPNKKLSTSSTSGRWILRNTSGFLAYVTTTGKVLDSKFQLVDAS